MSIKGSEENVAYDMISKSNERDGILIMIYTPNENKTEKQEKIKELRKKYKSLLDSEREYKEDEIRIFGKSFVKHNRNKCKIIYNNKKYALKEYFDEIDKNYNHDIKEIKLQLIGINNISYLEKMFFGCFHLSSLSESKNENIQEFISNSYNTFHDNNNYSLLFEENEKTNINKGNNKREHFIESPLCFKEQIKKIQKCDNKFTSRENKIMAISCIFSCCISLKSMPDISNWNTSNVRDMRRLFNKCNSLKSLPNISKWDTSNVTNMAGIFQFCNSLISLPDISNWNTSKVTRMDYMFNNCIEKQNCFFIYNYLLK